MGKKPNGQGTPLRPGMRWMTEYNGKHFLRAGNKKGGRQDMKDLSVKCNFEDRVDSKDNRFFKTLGKEMMSLFVMFGSYLSSWY